MDEARAEKIGKAIVARRLAMGYTQGRLAVVAGVSPGAVSNWENGRHIPTGDHAYRLANALETTPEKLGIGPQESEPMPRPVAPLWFDAWAGDNADRMGLMQKHLLRIEALLTDQQVSSASAQAESQHQ